jgi:hypothetical protein
MGSLGPLVLAWAHLREKRGGLLGPLLALVVCLVLLFTQVGLYQAARDLPLVPVAAITDPTQETPHDDSGRGDDGNPFARGFLIGAVGVFLLVLVVFRHLLVAELADHAREFALLHTLGYGPFYLRSVVFAEMLLLMLLAFVPSALLLPGVFALVRAWTTWPLTVSLAQVGVVLALTLLLALLVALLACVKLRGFLQRDLLE